MKRWTFLLFLLYSVCCFASCEKLLTESDDEEIDSLFTVTRLYRFSDFGIRICKGGAQGMDIYDDHYLFQAGLSNNTIYVFDLEELTNLGAISFSIPAGEPSHMNNINCGEKFNHSDVYPLLYVSQTSGSHACFVLRLSNDLSSYELIQTIKYIGNQHHINSNYDWFIDITNRFVYTYGKYNGLLEEREIVIFPFPSIVTDEIIFTDQDVIDSFTLESMSIYQGSRIINGLLFAPVGYGNSKYPGILKIIDLEKNLLVQEYAISCGEPEAIGQYKDGAIISSGGENPGYYYVQGF